MPLLLEMYSLVLLVVPVPVAARVLRDWDLRAESLERSASARAGTRSKDGGSGDATLALCRPCLFKKCARC